MSRVLVVRAGALGDTLMATPLIRALRARDPGAEIDFLCSAAARPLLEVHPELSRVFELRQRNVLLWLSPEKLRLVRELRARAYDYAVLLESAPAYRRLLEQAGIHDIRSIRDTFDPALHSVVNNLRAACFSGDSPPPMEVHLAPQDEMRADEMLKGLPRPIIGLHAGWGPSRRKAQQQERLKSWGPENFARLASLLEGSIVITGGPDDVAEAEHIYTLHPTPYTLVLAGRTTVRELAAVIQRLDLLVSVDSAPAHLAAALGTPLVVLWGPAILEQVRPLGDPARIRIVRHRVFCAPCYGTPMMKTCQRNICMEAISPERVAAEAKRMLSPGC